MFLLCRFGRLKKSDLLRFFFCFVFLHKNGLNKIHDKVVFISKSVETEFNRKTKITDRKRQTFNERRKKKEKIDAWFRVPKRTFFLYMRRTSMLMEMSSSDALLRC